MISGSRISRARCSRVFARSSTAEIVERTPATNISGRQDDFKSGGFQHLHCRDCGLRMKKIVEGVRPEKHFCCSLRPLGSSLEPLLEIFPCQSGQSAL